MKATTIILSIFISLEILALDLRDVTQVQLLNVGDGHLINKKPVKNFVSELNSEFSGVALQIKNEWIHTDKKYFEFGEKIKSYVPMSLWEMIWF